MITAQIDPPCMFPFSVSTPFGPPRSTRLTHGELIGILLDVWVYSSDLYECPYGPRPSTATLVILRNCTIRTPLRSAILRESERAFTPSSGSQRASHAYTLSNLVSDTAVRQSGIPSVVSPLDSVILPKCYPANAWCSYSVPDHEYSSSSVTLPYLHLKRI